MEELEHIPTFELVDELVERIKNYNADELISQEKKEELAKLLVGYFE